MTPTPSGIELPVLPMKSFVQHEGHEDEALQDYARAAVIADRARTAASCAGWVSVKDERKPEPGKVVIFWVHGERHEEDDEGNRVVHDVSGMHTGEWRVTEHGNYFDCHSTPCGDIEGVTHWMDPCAPATVRAERTDAATVAQLREDAERYRWLRAWTTGQSDARGRQAFALPDPHPLGNIMRGSVSQHLDAAIDAARAVPAPTAGDAGGATSSEGANAR
jgi:hypothetical protein